MANPDTTLQANAAQTAPPLYVDLDGTFLRTDSLYESVVRLLKAQPWAALLLPIWLLGGRAALKRKIAERVDMARAAWAVNLDLLGYLQAQKAAGRRIYLASAADAHIVSAVAERHGRLFDAWFASDSETNLSGRRKLAKIEAHAGGPFVYAGDAPIDAAVWAKAAGAILVGRPQALRRHVPDTTAIEAEFERPRRTLKTWAKALRLRQWAKNALVFVPIVLAGELGDMAALSGCAAAFFALSLAASATYLVNDLLDLDADRAHAVKKERPLARGDIPAFTATVTAGVLLIVAAALAAALTPPAAALGIAAYVVLTSLYSFQLKSVPLLDVLTIAGLFSLRIAIGVAAAQVAGSIWLFTFAMFFFFSLALTKRYAELRNLADAGASAAAGRGYAVTDLGLVQTLGVASAMVSVNVFVLYLAAAQFNAEAFPRPEWLWGVCAAMGYWVARMWLLATRGVLQEDPIEFALKDRVSLALAVLVVALAVLAETG